MAPSASNKKLQLVDGSYEFSEGLIATWCRPQFTEHKSREIRNIVSFSREHNVVL
jgi:hypothetical protein